MDLSMLSEAQRVQASAIIKKCALSRIYFVKEVLGVEHIEKWQMEQLVLLDSGATKLSIVSGHGVGKTTFCSWIGLHFLLFRDDVKVVITSPSQKQMRDGLVPEMNKWTQKLPEWMSMQLEFIEDRVSRLPNGKNNFVSFRTARKENPEALAGIHAGSVMAIVDEASGVDEVIYETGSGILSSPGAIIVLIGNGTRPSGYFYRTHHELSHLWKTRKVSCEESTRVTKEYIQTQAATYGVDSREYKVRVLGEFPDSGADNVIPREFAQSAVGREIYGYNEGSRLWGVDPGGGGTDPTGFVVRTDKGVLELVEKHYENVMQLVGFVKEKWDLTDDRLRPESIFIDSIGLGSGVASRLEEQGLPVVCVNVGELAPTKDRFRYLKDETWFSGREWFEKKNVTIAATNKELVAKFVNELSTVEKRYMSNGKSRVETKQELKNRGVKSPNLADAFMLTFAMGGAIQNGITNEGQSVYRSKKSTVYRAPHVW
jgi:phage terminase large subunit